MGGILGILSVLLYIQANTVHSFGGFIFILNVNINQNNVFPGNPDMKSFLYQEPPGRLNSLNYRCVLPSNASSLRLSKTQSILCSTWCSRCGEGAVGQWSVLEAQITTELKAKLTHHTLSSKQMILELCKRFRERLAKQDLISSFKALIIQGMFIKSRDLFICPLSRISLHLTFQ